MHAPVHRIPMPSGRPPWTLLTALPQGGSPHLLDALGAGGWGAGPGGDGPGSGLLALEPEIVFSGGLTALHEARTWLEAHRAEAKHGTVVLGSLDYELGLELGDGRVPRRSGEALPPVRLAGFRALYRYDARSGAAELIGSSREAVERLAARLSGAGSRPARRCTPLPRPEAHSSDADYARAVERVKAYIRAGDVYQVNLSRRLEARAPAAADLRPLYAALATRAGAPFSAYLETAERTVLSASPECFLRVAGRRVETCPIKGTRPRGDTPEADASLRKELESSVKDRAEHVMIVDLERNDLGRVCETGSVRVTRLCEPRAFSDVHHLVSRVEGRLLDPADWPGLIAATFPGGSITGAPKLRAMQIIAELEAIARGVYTGAIGMIDSTGDVDLSIAIRTAVASAGRLQLHLGGGIVADSEADAELRETRDKGRGFARSWDFAERVDARE
ncbi:MAG: anthranilate synthase component I family protein [Myxococcota bacterium]